MSTQASPPPADTPTLQPQPDPPGRLSNKRRAQLGVAVVVILIAIAGTLGRPQRATGAPQPMATPLLAPSPEAIDRQRERIDRTARPTTEAVDAAAVQALLRESPNSGPGGMDPAGSGGMSVDPNAQARAERKQREEEALFADTRVALDGEQPARQRGAPAPAAPAADRLPTADELTRDILAELGTAAPRPQAPAEPAAQPATTQSDPVRPARPARGLHRLYEGYVIDGTLLNRLTGDADGPVNVQVSNAMYAPDGALVIPAGAHVLGRARRVQTSGVSRVVVTFHRLLILQPDGSTSSVSLDQFDGLNGIGDVGLRDQVNRHYLATFGASAAVGLISGISQAVGGDYAMGGGGMNNTIAIGGGVTDATAQAVSQTMTQFLNRPWTVTIREGKRIKVWLTDDIDLPAYAGKEF